MKSESKLHTEIVRATKLWQAGKISKVEFEHRIGKATSELKDNKRQKKVLRNVDSRHGKKPSLFVQGGLPSLGKNQ